MYNKQMEMFQDGGLKDQGNTTDPVSGNDVPSGSLKEEVRDDIDAKLSPGEFVFPADVVRFIGLEKLMMIRDKAKKGLSRMEDMGQMGNSDEATIDDDVPFGMEDLIIVSGGPENEMSKGGVPSYGRGGQLIGDIGDGYQPPTRYYNPSTGQELMVTKIAGKFFPPLPKGFVPKPTLAQANPTSSTRVGTTSVIADDKTDESVAGFDVNNANVMTPQTSASGEQRGNAGTEKSTAEMSPSELADYGDWARDNPMKANAAAAFANYGTDFLSNPFGSLNVPGAVVTGIQSMFGNMNPDMLSAPSFPDDTPTERKAKEKDFKAALANINKDVGIGTLDLNKTRELAFLRNTAPDMYADIVKDFNRDQRTRAIEINRDNDIPSVSLTQVAGVSAKDIADLQDQISRGNVAPGAVAVGPNTHVNIGPYGAVVHRGEIIAGKFADKMKAKAEAAVAADREAASKVSKYGSSSTIGQQQSGSPGTPGPGTSGVGGKPGTQSDDTGNTDEGNTGPDTDTGPDSAPGNEAMGGLGGGAGAGADAGAEAAAGAETAGAFKGGFIRKKKKQKKMKRGGLASRK